jgi:hypothetical protein
VFYFAHEDLGLALFMQEAEGLHLVDLLGLFLEFGEYGEESLAFR